MTQLGLFDRARDDATGSVYTIPAGVAFLERLADAVLSGEIGARGRGDGPLDLADITLLLPTRRAARAAQEAFLKRGGQRTQILPQIRPIAEGEDTLGLLLDLAAPATAIGSPLEADALPPIPPLQRRLILTRLVMAWSDSVRAARKGGGADFDPVLSAGRETPAQAAQLAAELARLIDMVETENVSLDGIGRLVPERHSEHWQLTIRFLEIVTQFWPAYLTEHGLASPSAARNRAILAEARRLKEQRPGKPYIVAGVTGSIPATAELMRAVAGLPSGAIVLPNLDLSLDDESWGRIGAGEDGVPRHPEHPQFALKILLDRLGIDRKQVLTLLPSAGNAATTTNRPSLRTHGRLHFVAEAMRPASTTALWHDYARTVDRSSLSAALRGMHLIDAPSAQDEAEAIALILREALEVPGRTAALVSPDRLLARRVAARLETWGIRVDDSAGRPFPKTVPGAFLDLIVDAVHHRFQPAALMALLKHPLTRAGLGAFEVRRAARAIELAAFRTNYLGVDLDGVEAALEAAAADVASRERRERALRRLWDADWAGARLLVARLRDIFAPLLALYSAGDPQQLADLARAHITVAEALARTPEDVEAENAGGVPTAHELYLGEAGQAAATLFASLADTSNPALDIAALDYADLYRGLVARENVRLRVPLHPRLAIWGPFEARLQQPDIVVLGALNDGKWPEAADPGPWLNRLMRAELGLPAPEEQIGHAAHDFTSLLGAERVYLTRAEKVDGVPTVPSRWLMRIVALLDGMGMREAIATDRAWLGWARSRDAAPARRTIARPAPRPPVALRPRRMSVSGIEQWVANPYQIFARHVLQLEPLAPLGTPPDLSLRGSLIHDILADFARLHPKGLPEDAEESLTSIAREHLGPYLSNPRVAAFWLPRFERFARWFATTEPARRGHGNGRIVAEVAGQMVLDAPRGTFLLTARADRIDVMPEGLIITDYKTGQTPTASRVASGRSPQLPLEAAIASAGGFEGVPKATVIGLAYVRATGGTPPGEDAPLPSDIIGGLVKEQVDGLARLIARFDDPATPYAALRRPGFTYDHDDFAHLARVDEWSQEEADAEDE
ncbi:MAG: double-strand break repair protein AddB [Hyphomicrobiaceae bacterium]